MHPATLFQICCILRRFRNTLFFPQQKIPWFLKCRRKPLLFPQQKKHNFCKAYSIPQQNNHCFRIVVGRAFNARRPWGRSPSTRASKNMKRAPGTLFPQSSRNSTWWGSSHGATWLHIPRAIQRHRVAHACYTLRGKLGIAKEIWRGCSTWGKPQWKPPDPLLPQPSHNSPAAQPGFCHVLVCNKQQQNILFSITNICPTIVVLTNKTGSGVAAGREGEALTIDKNLLTSIVQSINRSATRSVCRSLRAGLCLALSPVVPCVQRG